MLAELKRLLDNGEKEPFLITFIRDVAGASPDEINMLRSASNWQTRGVEAAHVILRGMQAVADYRFDRVLDKR